MISKINECQFNKVYIYSLFIQTKINKQTKQNKTFVKIHESL